MHNHFKGYGKDVHTLIWNTVLRNFPTKTEKKKSWKAFRIIRQRYELGSYAEMLPTRPQSVGPCYTDLDDNQSVVGCSCCITGFRAPVIISLLDLKGNLEDAMDRKFNKPVKNYNLCSSPQPFCWISKIENCPTGLHLSLHIPPVATENKKTAP